MFSRSRFNPTPGVMDFWSEFRKPTPYRWPILFVSALPICVVLFWAVGERTLLPIERPTVSYITTFAADQTEQEIMARNEEFQAEADALQARRDELAARKKNVYRSLGRATGMNVDEIERGIDERKAQEETATSEQSAKSE